MRAWTVAALLIAAAHAAAGTAKPLPVERREPTQAERTSFDSFFREQEAAASARPVAPLFAPQFDIERRRGEPWQVIARVDAAPRHMAPQLCRQVRSSFIYDAQARRWTASASPPQWYVWLWYTTVPCAAARYTTLLSPAVPSEDAVALLQRHKELLNRARLLFAGNSQCVRQRALTFRLAGIEPAPPADGAPLMFGLVFESDRDTVARVAVRKSRGDYVAWNVTCSN